MVSSWQKTQVDNEPMGLYMSLPEQQGPFPAIVVIQHQGGVDAFVQKMTQRIAEAGYVGAAPDLYHRDGPECRDDGPTRRARLRDETLIKDVNATVAFLQAHGSVQSDNIGIIGFCMGGRVAYLMVAANSKFKAAIAYYGGNILVPWGQGPSPFERTREIHCPFLGHFGEDDRNPSPADMAKLDAELTKHGKIHEFYSYPGAGHAFLDDSKESYRPKADELSWPRTLDFFRRNLVNFQGRLVGSGR